MTRDGSGRSRRSGHAYSGDPGAFYFGGASNNVLLWGMVGNALFYALAALNIALRTDQQREEEKLTQRIGPSWGD
jgi:hypothetical protein